MKIFTETAVLFFSLSPEKEAERKPIFSGYDRSMNVQFYKELETQALTSCEDSGLPFFHFDEKLQRGKSFGSRFCNAIEDVFSYGFNKVIIIGNDSPDINSETILEGALGLEEGISRISPSQRGGFASLSISIKDYNRTKFLGIKWQSEKVCETMKAILGSHCQTLESYIEINDYNDLLEFVGSPEHYSAFYAYALGIVRPFQQVDPSVSVNIRGGHRHGLRFRGPPYKA